MPVQHLDDNLFFPSVDKTDASGIIAVGGDLSPERLLLAYRSGIFPWFDDDQPILWYAPDPRFVLFPQKLKVAKSMRSKLNSADYKVTINKDCNAVIESCKKIDRKDQYGTWITNSMKQAYNALHQMGFVHSIEVWYNYELVGGLYGMVIGNCFFGESMFHNVPNASKLAFIKLVQSFDFDFVDCQVHTNHLESLGAEFVTRDKYMTLLENGIKKENPFSTLEMPNYLP